MRRIFAVLFILVVAASAAHSVEYIEMKRVMARKPTATISPTGVKNAIFGLQSSATGWEIVRLADDSVPKLGGIDSTAPDGTRRMNIRNTISRTYTPTEGDQDTDASGVSWIYTSGQWVEKSGSTYNDTAVWDAVNARVGTGTYEADNAAIAARFANMSSQMSSLRGAFVAGGGTLSPAANSPLPTLAFGDVAVNTTSTLSTTIENTGLSALIFGAVTETDASNKFSITADACSGQTIAPSSSCLISVMFSPGAAAGGPYTAQLSYPHNAVGSPTLIALSGTGVSPGPSPVFGWYAESTTFPQTSDIGVYTITKASTNAGLTVAGYTGNAISQGQTTFTYWGIPSTVLTPSGGKIAMRVKHDTAAGSGDVQQRYFFKTANIAAANTIYAYTTNSDRKLWFIVYDSAGVVHRTYTTTGDWLADTWYLYEFEWNAAAGTTTVKRDGVPCTTTSSGQTAWSSNLSDWSAGGFTLGYTYPMGAFDDIYVY